MEQKQEKKQCFSKKIQCLFIIFLLLLPFLCAEAISKIVYNSRFSNEERKFLMCYMGLERDFIPNMISYYKPHHYLVYTLNHQSMEHYDGFFDVKSGYYINSLGFRGKEFTLKKPKGTYRIACLGGSTTFCMKELDERKTYPQMLEDALNNRYKSPMFEVINAGTPGWTTAESLINFHFRILELNADMIIVYHAVNDTFPMRRDNEGESDYINWRKNLDYDPPSPFMRTCLEYSVFCRLLYINTQAITSDIIASTIKKKPSSTDEDENLEKSTGKYFRRNIESIVELAKANNIVPVLMTMGHGPWHNSLASNNQIIREIAKEKGTILVDFEKVARPFYFTADNVHLNRSGNIARVKTITDLLSEKGLNFIVRDNSKML